MFAQIYDTLFMIMHESLIQWVVHLFNTISIVRILPIYSMCSVDD
jgi:hypothetical protein